MKLIRDTISHSLRQKLTQLKSQKQQPTLDVKSGQFLTSRWYLRYQMFTYISIVFTYFDKMLFQKYYLGPDLSNPICLSYSYQEDK